MHYPQPPGQALREAGPDRGLAVTGELPPSPGFSLSAAGRTEAIRFKMRDGQERDLLSQLHFNANLVSTQYRP